MKKCPHEVYWPDGDEIALSCALCNPLGIPDGPIPYITKRTELSLGVSGHLPKCSVCGAIVTASSGGTCLNCGAEHELKSPEDLRANAIMSGICPSCGSAVHYETDDKKMWCCADCEEKYEA